MLALPFVSLALLAPCASASWGGASLEVTAGTLQSVSGSFIVPEVFLPDNYVVGTQYAASTWVGIDGYCSITPNGPKCPNLLQTGVSSRIKAETSGEVVTSCYPWYEWYPANEIFFPKSKITCKAGDSISVSVTATSTTSGTATIINHSNGDVATTSLSSPNGVPLCLQFADCVVEQGSDAAAFSEIDITQPTTTLASGATALPTGKSVIIHNMRDSASSTYALGYAAVTAVTVDNLVYY